MKIAFYYHISINKNKNKLYCPGFLGVFIDSLANEVTKLTLLMHEDTNPNNTTNDYLLQAKNITFLSLGKKTPAWHRAIFYKSILKKKMDALDASILIVRSPSPLAPYFFKYKKNKKVVYLIVGDYSETVKHKTVLSIRDKIISKYLKYNDVLFRKSMHKIDVLVNSPALFKKYKNQTKSIHLIKTTTLSNSDFFTKIDTCVNTPIELLYTGRIDLLKGLLELVNATAQLIKQDVSINLNIVGWEDDITKPIENILIKKSIELNIEKNVIFHGKKAIGNELNKMYQMADIYVLPSYQEGFPRTIWEAMANSLPVIATKVGGIPDYLTHKKNVLLINPKNSKQITQAVETIINQKELRKELIKNGITIAKDATLEVQSKKILTILQKILK